MSKKRVPASVELLGMGLSLASTYLKAKYLLPMTEDVAKICEGSPSDNTKKEGEGIRGQMSPCCQNRSSNNKADNYNQSTQTGISSCIVTTFNKLKNQVLNNIRKLFQIFLNCLPQFWIVRPARFVLIFGLGLGHNVTSYKNPPKCNLEQSVSQPKLNKSKRG